MKKVLFFITLLCIPFIVSANELTKNAKSAILIEASTGKILYEKNSHEKLAPASMTKIMSMLLIMENIDSGIIKWDDKVVTSKNASDMGGSQILLEEGEVMTVKELFKGIAIASGNDAVVSLAEYISGSEEEFVKEMNNKAKELGLKDTNFKNPHGLDVSDHYSSAYDMSIIAKELLKHEEVLKYTSIYEDYLRKGTNRELWLVNTNKLIKFNKYVDGLKTGYTKEAGYCLTATAKKDNLRLISVVMGEEEINLRNQETTELLNYGFSKYKSKEVLNKNTIIDKLDLELADNKANIVPKESYSVVSDKKSKIGKITYKLHLNNINIPVKKGEKIGYITIKENNKEIKDIDVTVDNNIKKANLLKLYGRYLKSIVNGDLMIK